MSSGCGRVGFDEVTATGGQGPKVWDGVFTVSEPVPVPELTSGQGETECIVLPDSRTMYFHSNLPDSLGGHDIYSAVRAGPGLPFGSIVHHGEISTSSAEARLSTGDYLHAFFWSTRPGGSGASDIWEVTRSSPAEDFLNVNAVNHAVLNTTEDEYDPWSSRDALRVYYASKGDIVVAERPSVDVPFGPPTAVEGVNSTFTEDNPAFSADERFIVFSATRDDGLGGRDIYFSHRPDRFSLFAAPQLMPTVNTGAAEWEACITEDDELFFSSDRDSGADSLYYARFLPVPAP